MSHQRDEALKHKLNLEKFHFAVGIEDTFVTQTEKGERPLDEYELTGHYEQWEEDLNLAKSTGASMIRYGIPWHRIEETEGEFQWGWTDQVMNYFERNPDFEPIIDFIHYGTPEWMKKEFLHPEFPEYAARFAREFFKRYKHVSFFTPLNEPYVNAEYCGWIGKWPPYRIGLKGFSELMVQLGKGIIRIEEEVKDVRPESIAVHVDATKRYIPENSSLEEDVLLNTEISMYSWEMIQGRLGGNPVLLPLIQAHGVSDEQIKWFEQRKITPDIIGINYYPQFSVHDVKKGMDGQTELPHRMGDASDLIAIADRFFSRYSRPVFITETSFRGSENERIQWLKSCAAAVKAARQQGKKLIGCTWFPFYDLVDWEYRTSGKTAEEELLPFGLYTLNQQNGKMQRVRNEVCAEFERTMKDF